MILRMKMMVVRLGLIVVVPSLAWGQLSQYSVYSELAKSVEGLAGTRPTRATGTSTSLPEDLVSDIHCMETNSVRTFSSKLRLPSGHTAPPVLEEVTDPSSSCRISSTSLPAVYTLELDELADCGVRECSEQGELWLCILVRFPLIKGLMLPEDEVINIKCHPQDRSVAGNNVVNFKENIVEQRSPAIFTGGGQDFLSEIGLFRKLAGTDLFAARVKSGSSIELGENVQLRSIVRSGDGWNYSKLTDVVVHRVHNGKPLTGSKNTVQLVNPDGCRNKEYKALAPYLPWRDSSNSLINNFDFRVFMFQEMESGDSIMITAQVLACVEEEDCRVACGDRIKRNGEAEWEAEGGRSKRAVPPPQGRTEGWKENMEIKVSMPDLSKEGSVSVDECRLYMILTLAIALTFCVLSAIIVLFACYRKWREIKKRNEVETSKTDPALETTKIVDNETLSSLPPSYYLVPCSRTSSAPNRPVTVRSVKRRDRGKSLERRGMVQGGTGEVEQTVQQQEQRAVMV